MENIALIKEVHEYKNIYEAQNEAKQWLKYINLEEIATKRSNQCSKNELFFVMLIRAYMMPTNTIGIGYIFNLVQDLDNIEPIIEALKKFPVQKNILFFDKINNQHLYANVPLAKEKCNV
jgi:ABC-type lipoprotein export system ATPase subunit